MSDVSNPDLYELNVALFKIMYTTATMLPISNKTIIALIIQNFN